MFVANATDPAKAHLWVIYLEGGQWSVPPSPPRARLLALRFLPCSRPSPLSGPVNLRSGSRVAA